jgi:hypothetical protein
VWEGAGCGSCSPKLRWYEQAREGEKEAQTDVAFAVVGNNNLCKALVDGHVLLECCALAKQFRLGRIRNCTVQTRPEHPSRRSAVALGKAKVRRTWWQNSSQQLSNSASGIQTGMLTHNWHILKLMLSCRSGLNPSMLFPRVPTQSL